jgi:hypothetical protein
MMALMPILGALFGSGNVVKETAEVFRVNAEAQAQRGANYDTAALAQMAAEFQARGQRGWFDRFMDGVNRVPRPAIVLGLLGLLVWTPIDPDGAAKTFAAWAALPEGFWVIFGVIVTFFFGGRDLAKNKEHALSLARMMVPAVSAPDPDSDIGQADAAGDSDADLRAQEPGGNAALDEIMGR